MKEINIFSQQNVYFFQNYLFIQNVKKYCQPDLKVEKQFRKNNSSLTFLIPHSPFPADPTLMTKKYCILAFAAKSRYTRGARNPPILRILFDLFYFELSFFILVILLFFLSRWGAAVDKESRDHAALLAWPPTGNAWLLRICLLILTGSALRAVGRQGILLPR